MCKDEECIICKNYHEFVLPGEIIEASKRGDLIIFAGAGISTEGRGVFPNTLYEVIAHKLGKKNLDISFSELMEEFCALPNGRINLIREFMDRLDYVEAFPEMYFWACRFHRELQTIYSINEIVTTNWDNYFEKFCGCTPFVFSNDFALSGTSTRKVYKIHGSISNLGSIVATTSDYDNCYKNLHNGLIGNKLKLLMGDPQKLVVFIGYSLTDEDFIRINEFLEKEMGDFMPHSYVVSLDNQIANRLNPKLFTPIITDATFFIHKLKSALVSEGIMYSDDLYEFAEESLETVLNEHMFLSNEDSYSNPDYLYSMVYQDGLIHSYQRVKAMKKTGYYSNPCNVHKSIQSYNELVKEAKNRKRYIDYAYLVGYLNGHISLVTEDSYMFPPLYFLGENEGAYTLEEYLLLRDKYFSKNKKMYNAANEIKKNNPKIRMHHPPRL